MRKLDIEKFIEKSEEMRPIKIIHLTKRKAVFEFKNRCFFLKGKHINFTNFEGWESARHLFLLEQLEVFLLNKKEVFFYKMKY
jgi:hypothetical protein